VFFSAYPNLFCRLSEILYCSIFQNRLTPCSADPALSSTCTCLCLFLTKKSMDIPRSPPRATITLGLGLIKSHSPVLALLCVYPPNRPTSSESHIVAADILQRPGHYKTHHICCWNSLQQHHRLSPSERLTSERLAFDTLRISLTWTKSQPVYPTTSKTS